MGLDLVEFAFAVENAFGLYIPDPEAADLVTPELLVDYLVKRLPPADTRQHLDQVAFYRISNLISMGRLRGRCSRRAAGSLG
jgi:hypothetical protein